MSGIHSGIKGLSVSVGHRKVIKSKSSSLLIFPPSLSPLASFFAIFFSFLASSFLNTLSMLLIYRSHDAFRQRLESLIAVRNRALVSRHIRASGPAQDISDAFDISRAHISPYRSESVAKCTCTSHKFHVFFPSVADSPFPALCALTGTLDIGSVRKAEPAV